MSLKWVPWVAWPAALLVAGCIIVPGNPGWDAPESPVPAGINPAGAAAPASRTPQARQTVRASTDATVPVIASLTASPTTLTEPGQEVVFHIAAYDASGTPSYHWSATGGTLTATAGTRVGWRSPSKPGRYTVLVVVTSPSGGATTGAVNIEVLGDGTGAVQVPDPEPTAAPEAEPTPTPGPADDAHAACGFTAL